MAGGLEQKNQISYILVRIYSDSFERIFGRSISTATHLNTGSWNDYQGKPEQPRSDHRLPLISPQIDTLPQMHLIQSSNLHLVRLLLSCTHTGQTDLVLLVDQWIVVNSKRSIVVADDTLKISSAPSKQRRARRPFLLIAPATSPMFPRREQS